VLSPGCAERPDSSGFTLVEVVLAMLLLSVAVVSMLRAFPPGLKQIPIFEGKADAIYAAQSLMEEIRARRWDEHRGGRTPPGSLGPDPGELKRSDFDDIDDYKGYSDSLGSCLRTVDVVYVNDDSIDAVWSSPTDTKRISVTVSNAAAGSDVRLTLFMTNH